MTAHSSSLNFDFDGFFTYLKVTQNKNNDTAKATIRDVKLYLDFTKLNEFNESDELKLLNIKELERFLSIMKDKKMYKPTTMAEKLRRLKLAIKFIIRQQDDQQLFYQGHRIIDMLDEWCHGLKKDIGMQRQQHAILMRERLYQISDPNEFLDHEMVCIAPPSYACVIFSYYV